jgi:hypothetical protein
VRCARPTQGGAQHTAQERAGSVRRAMGKSLRAQGVRFAASETGRGLRAPWPDGPAAAEPRDGPRPTPHQRLARPRQSRPKRRASRRPRAQPAGGRPLPTPLPGRCIPWTTDDAEQRAPASPRPATAIRWVHSNHTRPHHRRRPEPPPARTAADRPRRPPPAAKPSQIEASILFPGKRSRAEWLTGFLLYSTTGVNCEIRPYPPFETQRTHKMMAAAA